MPKRYLSRLYVTLSRHPLTKNLTKHEILRFLPLQLVISINFQTTRPRKTINMVIIITKPLPIPSRQIQPKRKSKRSNKQPIKSINHSKTRKKTLPLHLTRSTTFTKHPKHRRLITFNRIFPLPTPKQPIITVTPTQILYNPIPRSNDPLPLRPIIHPTPLQNLPLLPPPTTFPIKTRQNLPPRKLLHPRHRTRIPIHKIPTTTLHPPFPTNLKQPP